MTIKKIFSQIIGAFTGAGRASAAGLRVIKSRPQILIYPYIAVVFILLTFPIVNGLVFEIWNSVWQNSLFDAADGAPKNLRILLGLVTFSFFYTTFVTGFFSVATAAEVSAKLKDRQAPLTQGLRAVAGNFPRTLKFSLAAIFFFPLGIIAQRHKSARSLLSVIGSSLSLNMAQLAPVILDEKKPVLATIRQSVDTLGDAWKENLVIKTGMWLTIFLLLSIGFLPQLLQENWINKDTAALIGSLSAILLSFAAYVVTKVLGAVFTATLYHQTSNKKL